MGAKSSIQFNKIICRTVGRTKTQMVVQEDKAPKYFIFFVHI